MCSLFLVVLPAAFVLGCAADAERSPPSEQVSAPEWNVALAMVRDGDSIFVGRAERLDRIDAATGVVTVIAGPEWAECPGHPSITWLPTVMDYGYPNLVVRGTTLYLVQSDCGLWSFDTVTKQQHMLVDPTPETRAKRLDAEGVFPDGATWNGKTGPDWNGPFGLALAADGDGLIACFQANAHEPDPRAPDGSDFRQRIELWSLATDGTPREMLTFIDPEPSATNGEDYCKHVIPDATSILFSTDRSILRFDRETRAVTTLVSGYTYGTDGLAQDATDVFYIGPRNDVLRIPRGGGEPLVLRASSNDPREPARMTVTLDGEHVYFDEGYSLMRVNKDGSGLITLSAGDDGSWVLPMTLGIGDDHVYFEGMTGSTSGDAKLLGALYRTAR